MTAMVLLSDWMASQVEFWLPVEGFPGYDVSNQGKVRSWRAANGMPQNFPRLVHVRTDRPYQSVRLKGNEGRKSLIVHRLVAIMFTPNPNKLPEVNHLTGIKSDNRVENLAWATRRENIRHAFKHGLFKSRRGTANRSAKLSENDVREIYQRVSAGENGEVIAKEFGITRTTPSDIFNGKTWSHLNLCG